LSLAIGILITPEPEIFAPPCPEVGSTQPTLAKS
jgi:hypothetical protein